ncbi:4-hydroxybenzoate octaprenyltransferase [Maricaulaceae bacterium EIL42A08]|nr:4-hydroxybenzoate octaprenyltransferase [Maricaulaceae bacterium EIL42A08]
MTEPLNTDRRVADSLPTSWVDRAPSGWRPYLRLARYDRPVGFWLLALPCWIGLAAARLEAGLEWSDLYWALLFGIGSVAMRGAGCTYNDIVDRDLDAKVARTADRPLAAGTVSLKAAWGFLIVQCLVGLLVLIQLPLPAILTGLAALALVAAYPFMKRITWWPQAWLGLTFNWGVPVAGAAALGTPFAPEVLVLYAAMIAWTVGYDTIYACQDMEDDALVGVKSSARAMGEHIYRGVLFCYVISAALVLTAGVIAGAGLFFALGFALYAAHLFSQLKGFDPEDGMGCLKRFKSNQITGLVLVAAFVAGGL